MCDERRGLRRRDEGRADRSAGAHPGREILTIPGDKLELGYRTSVIAKKGYIVLEAKLRPEKGQETDIRARMEDLKNRRVTKQPLEYQAREVLLRGRKAISQES